MCIGPRQSLGIAHVDIVDLRPAGDARQHGQHAALFPFCHEFALHRQARAWPDKAQLAAQDIDDLRQLVNLCAAQERADAGDRIGPNIMRARLLGAGAHRAEFVADKFLSIPSDAGLREYRRAGAGHFDGDEDNGK